MDLIIGFLPSKDELNLLYEVLHVNGMGSFATDKEYWSSTQDDANRAWAQCFRTGNQQAISKQTELHVRPIRGFWSQSSRLPRITIVNETGMHISLGFIRESETMLWGDDAIGAMFNGTSRTIRLNKRLNQADTYDVRLRANANVRFTKFDIKVYDGMTIVFSAADRDPIIYFINGTEGPIDEVEVTGGEKLIFDPPIPDGDEIHMPDLHGNVDEDTPVIITFISIISGGKKFEWHLCPRCRDRGCFLCENRPRVLGPKDEVPDRPNLVISNLTHERIVFASIVRGGAAWGGDILGGVHIPHEQSRSHRLSYTLQENKVYSVRVRTYSGQVFERLNVTVEQTDQVVVFRAIRYTIVNAAGGPVLDVFQRPVGEAWENVEVLVHGMHSTRSLEVDSSFSVRMDVQGRDVRTTVDDTYTVRNVHVTNGTEIRILPEHKDAEPSVIIQNSTVSRATIQWMLPNSNEWTNTPLTLDSKQSGELKLPYPINDNHNLYSFRMVLNARERVGTSFVNVPFYYSRNNVTVYNGMNIEILQENIELPEGKFIIRGGSGFTNTNAGIRPTGTIGFTQLHTVNLIQYHIYPIPGGGNNFDIVLTRQAGLGPGGRDIAGKFGYPISPRYVVLFTNDDLITERPMVTIIHTNTPFHGEYQSLPSFRPSGNYGLFNNWTVFSGHDNHSTALLPGESVTRYLPYPIEMFDVYDFRQAGCQHFPRCTPGYRPNLKNISVRGDITMEVALPCAPYDGGL